jgi:hypothetical protein
MRYNRRKVLVNNLRMYDSLLEGRNKKGKGIRIFESPDMNFPTSADMSSLIMEPHRWTVGDRFFKLAHEHYGDAQYWWVIAWFNLTPTEAHVDRGDLLYIPHPLDDALDLYNA